MARPLYASFLPTIKCSSCGVEIEISAMGEHLCFSQDDAAQTYNIAANADHTYEPSPRPSEPLSINTELAFRSNAEVHAHGNTQSPSQKPLEFAMSPSPTPSPLPLENHLFGAPSPNSSTANTIPRKKVSSPLSTSVSPSQELNLPQNSPLPSFPPQNGIARSNVPPRITLSETAKPTSNPGDTPDVSNTPLSPSLASPMSSSGANVLKRMNTITPGPFKAWGRREEDSTTNASSETDNRRTSPRANPPPARPPRPETDDSLAEQLQNCSNSRINTDIFTQSFQMSETSQVEPSTQQNATDQASSTSTDEEISPLPQFSQPGLTWANRRGYSLTESESSTGSPSSSEIHTNSSRSSRSPMTSAAPSDAHASPLLDQESGAREDDALTTESRCEQTKEPPARASMPLQPAPLQTGDPSAAKQPSLTRSNTSSEVFLDGEQRLSSLRYDPSVSNGRASGPEADLRKIASVRRPRPAPKGNCRGCSKPIVGKSIRAADGRLSGRWHKECLVCRTCRAPFQTADFYVLRDHPYCAHHYHVLNHSICQSCNAGIEGQYLEIQPSRKYHLTCFTCHDCQKTLSTDYFEVNGLFYCESDAYRAWQKSKMLTPGRRFPERRATKMMTMA